MHPQRNDSSYLFDWMERLVRSAGPDLFRLLERVEARLRMGDPLVPSGTGETERHGPGSDRHDVLLTVPEAAKPPRAERRERAIWTGTQAASFLRTTRDDDRYGALWAVAAGTGLRRAELIGLRWADVDPERGFLVVRRATTKTRAGARTLRLPSLAVAALRAHRARQNARRLALGPGWHDGDLVFDRGDGRALPPRTVDDAFTRATARAGLPPIRLHDLRHGFATMLGRARVPVKTISAMLGHANVGITLDLYTHLDLVDQDGAVAALEEALAQPEEDGDRASAV